MDYPEPPKKEVIMKPIPLSFFNDVPAVLAYVTSELVATLHEDADDCEGARDLAQANELRAKIDDIEAVSALIEAAQDLLAALQDTADQLQHYLLSAEDNDDAESAYQHARAIIATIGRERF